MTVHAVLAKIPPTTCANTPESVAQQRLFATLALSRSAALSEAPMKGYTKSASGAPQPNGGFAWSVSHKHGLAGGVVARGRVGIDVELVAPRRSEMLDELAAPGEWSRVGDRSVASFARLWTAKEAVLKACGQGIGRFGDCVLDESSADSMTLDFEGDRWVVVHHWLEDHVAAVAVPEGEVRWHLIEPESSAGECGR